MTTKENKTCKVSSYAVKLLMASKGSIKMLIPVS